MIDFLVKNWWVSVSIVLLMVLADYYLTVLGAKSHQAYAAGFITFQNGYELNPVFEKDVAQYRWFTRRNALALLILGASLSIFGLFGGKILFELFFGACMAQWLYIDLHHLQNLVLFQNMRRPDSISGHIEYSYWISQRSSAVNALCYAVIFGVAGVLTMRLFFWGGVLALVGLALRCYRLSKRKFTEKPAGLEAGAME